jgi:hypothetical protein
VSGQGSRKQVAAFILSLVVLIVLLVISIMDRTKIQLTTHPLIYTAFVASVIIGGTVLTTSFMAIVPLLDTRLFPPRTYPTPIIQKRKPPTSRYLLMSYGGTLRPSTERQVMTISELPDQPESELLYNPETMSLAEARRSQAIQIALSLNKDGNLGDLLAHSMSIEKYLENGLPEADKPLTEE